MRCLVCGGDARFDDEGKWKCVDEGCRFVWRFYDDGSGCYWRHWRRRGERGRVPEVVPWGCLFAAGREPGDGEVPRPARREDARLVEVQLGGTGNVYVLQGEGGLRKGMLVVAAPDGKVRRACGSEPSMGRVVDDLVPEGALEVFEEELG